MKKQLFPIISGLLFLVAAIMYYQVNISLKFDDSNLQIKSMNNSEYSAFSSGFYRLKSKLKRTDSTGFILPGNAAAVMLAIDPKYRTEPMNLGLIVDHNKRKIEPAMGLGGNKPEIRNESIIYYSFTGCEFEKTNQFLLTIVIVTFLLFFTSFFRK